MMGEKKIAISSRLNSFSAQPQLFQWEYGTHDPRDLIRRATLVKGQEYISVNYPEHFPDNIKESVILALKKSGLKTSTVNMRYTNKSSYLAGAFTNSDEGVRKDAIEVTKQGVDLCSELSGTDLVLWLGSDGFDYPFQMDYARAWDMELQGIAEVVDYAEKKGIRISIEYKPCEPRKFCLLGNFGTTFAAVRQINKPNLGITCDFCHMLMAREAPAQSVALALEEHRLFGMHLNDGYGFEDDGLAMGSIHFFETLEIVRLLEKYNYDGFIYFDTFPATDDPVRECEINFERYRTFQNLSKKLDAEFLEQLLAKQDGLNNCQAIFEKAL